MLALRLESDGPRLVADHPEPRPAAGEALVRVRLAGICATDLQLVTGYAGFRGVLGHELVGEVEAAPGHEAWVGRRVVAEINVGCGDCPACRGAGPEHCRERRVIGIRGRDGVFAERVALPVANLHEVPDGVADEAAVFTEPLAAALRIREQVATPPGTRAAVLGPGRLGLLAAQALAAGGVAVRVLGRRPESLELPARLGLETALAADVDAGAFDVVVEATGRPEGLGEALRLVRPLGTVVLKSTFHGAAPVDLAPAVVDEVTLVGSRCGPFAPALALLERGAVSVEPLIDARYPLDRALEALEHAARPGVRKVLLQPP